MVFAKKIPSPELLQEYYNDRPFRNLYISPVTLTRYDVLLDRFEPYRRNNRIMDFGCGGGAFLERARHKGWEVYGIESTERHIERCRDRGIENVTDTPLTPGVYPEGFFDVVTSFEVLEHIGEPAPVVRSVHSILRRGGVFYCTTPNFNALLRLYAKADHDVIFYPGHLCYFTPATISRFLRDCGFETLRMETTGISITSFKNRRRTTPEHHVAAASEDEQLRKKIESRKHLQVAKKAVNIALNLFGVGDTIKATCIKL
jgi:2-polyprenyl-3-methyl-5-hydroxy-6-metoxy-1,4-benzoquinol methylase